MRCNETSRGVEISDTSLNIHSPVRVIAVDELVHLADELEELKLKFERRAEARVGTSKPDEHELGKLFDRLVQMQPGPMSTESLRTGLVLEQWEQEDARQVSDMIEIDYAGVVTKEAFLRYFNKYTEHQDDKAVVWRLFRKLDRDGIGIISLESLETALDSPQEHHKELGKALVDSALKLRKGAGFCNGNGDGLSYRDLYEVVSKLPRVSGERVKWVRSLGLDGELARLLEPGTVFDGLSGLLKMSDDQLQGVCDDFSRRLPGLLKDGVRKLRARVESSGVKLETQEANSKFSGTAGSFYGKFATLKDFYQGPEGLIGQPNPKLMEGMNREHCKRESTKRFFVTSNYLLRTTAEWEWYWVQNPSFESLPTELQRRLNYNNKYPGEVGDNLKECEIQLTLLKANFEDVALESCKADICARLIKLAESKAQMEFVLSVASASSGNESTIQIRVHSNRRLSAAEQSEILEALSTVGAKLDKAGMPDVSECYLDWKFRIIISKSEIMKSFQEKLAGALGILFDEKQCLMGARIIVSRQPSDDHDDSSHTTVVIAVPCSDLNSTTKVHDILAGFNLREIARNFKSMEYKYCESENEATRHHKQGRMRQGTSAQFFASYQVREVQARLIGKGLVELIQEEVIALRLYTGPLFVLYNAVLRGFPLSITGLLREENGEINRFETTIFVICSGISKLSRLTDVPPNRLLYRGLGGMLLPDQFWTESEEGFRGGVEYGLMSTTTKRSVAVEYSGIKHKRGILLEIQAGRIDIGASISFLSQYPGEEEYLMPPLSCMEVIGEPRLETMLDGEILVFPLRLNVNLKSLTVEDLTQRRKVLHLSMAKNLREEIAIAAAARIDDLQATEQRRAEGFFFEHISGDMSQVTISKDNLVKFSDTRYATVGAPSLWLSHGKVYFEVEVKDACGEFYIGWAGCNFQGDYVGSDEMSWSVSSEGFFAHRTICRDSVGPNLNAAGKVLGVALDFESGVMRASVNGAEQGVIGGSADLLVKPSPTAGGSLFPALSGCGGCELALKIGRNSFIHAPSSTEYTSLTEACSDRLLPEAARDGAGRTAYDNAGLNAVANYFLILGLSKEALGAKFNSLIGAHAAMAPDEFNDDDMYKRLLNQALDLKVCLLEQLETVIMLRKEGASLEQLKVCADANASDFQGRRLQAECPGFLWRSILTRCFLTELVTIPLTLPACQACLIWEGVLVSDTVHKVALGGNARDDEVLDLSALLPSFNLLASKVQGNKYGCAMLGLLLASNRVAKNAPRHARVVREVNLRGIEFSNECKNQVLHAVEVGCVGGWVTRLNELSLEDNQAVNFKHALRRADKPLEGPLGKELHEVLGEWRFVLGAVHARAWSTLDLSCNEIGHVCVGWVMAGLSRCQTLGCLHLSGNDFGDEGAKAVAAGLDGMASLKTLHLASCGITAEGAEALAAGLEGMPSLVMVNLSGNKFGDEGARALVAALSGMSSLQSVQLASCEITVEGAKALAAGLGGLPSLVRVNLGPEFGGYPVEALRTLLHAKVDVDGRNQDGWAPIHYAANNGHVEAVRVLMEGKADVYAKDNDGWAPIHRAACEGYVAAVRTLMEGKADTHAKNNNGRAPLHVAAFMGHVEAVRALIEGKADVHAKDNEGKTPVDRAFVGNEQECVKVLREGGEI